MDTIELRRKLEEFNIPSKWYSLDGTLKPMATILMNSNDEWWTFDYDERGRVQDKMQFDTESQACQHILNRLIHLKQFKEKYNLK